MFHYTSLCVDRLQQISIYFVFKAAHFHDVMGFGKFRKGVVLQI